MPAATRRPPPELRPAPARTVPAPPKAGSRSRSAPWSCSPPAKTVPISQLKVGDKVLAADTKTGKDQPETVTAVLVHHDTDLYNLTVKTATGTELIHTTSNHLFGGPGPLSALLGSYEQTIENEHPLTANGSPATVVGGSVPAVHDGWIWDLTVPGNNDHDFYAMAGELLGRISRSGYYCRFPLRADGSDVSDGHFSEPGRRRLRHSWASSARGYGG
jgi:hypothetical protein